MLPPSIYLRMTQVGTRAPEPKRGQLKDMKPIRSRQLRPQPHLLNACLHESRGDVRMPDRGSEGAPPAGATRPSPQDDR